MDGKQQHISKQFDDALEDLRGRVMAMGGLVEQQLVDAVKALVEGDLERAKNVIENERQVDKHEVAIDQKCNNILATRQPAARDLRLIMSISKTITDMERIGDEAEKIARMAIEMKEKQGPRSYYIGINAMGNLVSNILRDALDAFARMDLQDAVSVAGKEPESDDQYNAILRQLITYMMEDARNIGAALDAVWAVRALERIADHARNVCENVFYLVKGKDVRHGGLEQMEKIIAEPE